MCSQRSGIPVTQHNKNTRDGCAELTIYVHGKWPLVPQQVTLWIFCILFQLSSHQHGKSKQFHGTVAQWKMEQWTIEQWTHGHKVQDVHLPKADHCYGDNCNSNMHLPMFTAALPNQAWAHFYMRSWVFSWRKAYAMTVNTFVYCPLCCWRKVMSHIVTVKQWTKTVNTFVHCQLFTLNTISSSKTQSQSAQSAHLWVWRILTVLPSCQWPLMSKSSNMASSWLFAGSMVEASSPSQWACGWPYSSTSLVLPRLWYTLSCKSSTDSLARPTNLCHLCSVTVLNFGGIGAGWNSTWRPPGTWSESSRIWPKGSSSTWACSSGSGPSHAAMGAREQENREQERRHKWAWDYKSKLTISPAAWRKLFNHHST